MRGKSYFLVIIFLFFFVGAVKATGIPDTITVTPNSPWIIANNVDQSTITVSVSNTTPGYNGPVKGATVNLTIDPLYGTASPTTVTTNINGTASSTFKVKTKSGEAQIIAEKFYAASSLKSISEIQINKIFEHKYSNETSFYIFTFNKGGFVIVSADHEPVSVLRQDLQEPIRPWGSPSSQRMSQE